MYKQIKLVVCFIDNTEIIKRSNMTRVVYMIPMNGEAPLMLLPFLLTPKCSLQRTIKWSGILP